MISSIDTEKVFEKNSALIYDKEFLESVNINLPQNNKDYMTNSQETSFSKVKN